MRMDKKHPMASDSIDGMRPFYTLGFSTAIHKDIFIAPIPSLDGFWRVYGWAEEDGSLTDEQLRVLFEIADENGEILGMSARLDKMLDNQCRKIIDLRK